MKQMHDLSCCASICLLAVYSQSIDKHFTTYEIDQAIDYLRNLLCSLQDAYLSFQNEG